jgi:ActR/RegA family two-component response regulator
MKNKALVIQNIQSQTFDANAFMTARNLVADYCSTGSGALSAIKTTQYRCVVVSMDIAREDPIEIIGALRGAEHELGLSPTQILVVSGPRQPTSAEMAKFNISAQIRPHQLK